MPGMFCEVIATTNSGIPMLMVAASENDGVVHTGVATSSVKPLKSSNPSRPDITVPAISAARTA